MKSSSSQVLRRKTIISPEGVPLEFTIATAGDRAAAFILDFVFMTLISLAIVLPAGLFSGFGSSGGWLMAIAIVLVFLNTTFYHVYFEMRWQGLTPGKRRLKLRVIDRDGGTLSPRAVFARNLTRNLEIYLPVAVIVDANALFPDAPGWVAVLAGMWLLVLAFFPVFNRERLRMGDIIAGTLVIVRPEAMLSTDLGSARTKVAQTRATYDFTREQLEIYGIYELQVLEDLLRGKGANDPTAVAAVCEMIKRKISWPADRWKVDAYVFLEDFYAAQRGRLEHEMLMGKRRERKKH